MSIGNPPGSTVETFDAPVNERPGELAEIGALRSFDKIEPPPWFVAGVMTRVSQPRLPTFGEWLRRPFPIEIRISPLTMIGLVAALAAAFLYLGATFR